MSSQQRRDRRRAELEQRREQRRTRRPPERSLLLPASIAAVASGLLAVVAFAVLNAPPASVELKEPIPPSAYQFAEGRALGRSDAPLTLEIWSDFQCPACGQLVDVVEPRLVQDYVTDGRLRLEYRDFAFIGEESFDAAVGARCAERQGRFWQYHDYLFANQSGENRGAFADERLDAIAAQIGLEMSSYRSCVDEPAVRTAVTDERDEGRTLGVTSTPSLFVAGELIAGVPDYSQLSAFIDAALANTGATQ